jgi:hypothetical protein
MCICMCAALCVCMCVCLSVCEYIHIESLNYLKVHDKLSNIVAVPQQTEELVIYTLHPTLKKKVNFSYAWYQSPV